MIHEFDPVIYPNLVWISYDLKDKYIKNHFKFRSGSIIDSDYSNSNGACLKVTNLETNMNGVLILFQSKKKMSFNTVAHESSHAAKFIFEYIGADINEHEPFEYLLGWIAGCCENVKKHRKTVK